MDEFEVEKDGAKAFIELQIWDGGDDLITKTAKDVRSKLDKLTLFTRSTGSRYINNFQ